MAAASVAPLPDRRAPFGTAVDAAIITFSFRSGECATAQSASARASVAPAAVAAASSPTERGCKRSNCLEYLCSDHIREVFSFVLSPHSGPCE